MYHAKVHPEQYSNTLTDAQMKQLHKSIHHICSTAVDLLGDSDQFPEDWLFKHRWAKGKKDKPNQLPNGEKIVFLTVGGRTSAVIPSVQKKTGPVTKDVEKEGLDGNETDEVNGDVIGEPVIVKGKNKANSSVKRVSTKEEDQNLPNESPAGNGRRKREVVPKEEDVDEEPTVAKGAGKKRKVEESSADLKKSAEKVNGVVSEMSSSKRSKKAEIAEEATSSGRRRSTRTRA